MTRGLSSVGLVSQEASTVVGIFLNLPTRSRIVNSVQVRAKSSSSLNAIASKVKNGAVLEKPMPNVQERPLPELSLSDADREVPWMEGGISHLGSAVDGGVVYRERFVIRCYEVGVNRTASIETIANLLQEVGTNHAQSAGFTRDGMATTTTMLKPRLIWATTRMHVEMYKYPKWGEVVEVDTWFQGEGSIVTRRDWIIRLADTGEVIGRATSSWVMMNRDTRRLSKIPPDVWEELSAYAPNPPRLSLPPEAVQKLPKLEEPADYMKSNLRARRSDLDMNQHVNNVTYIAWMLESLPQSLLDSTELVQISLEYRRECSQDDVLETLAKEYIPDPASLAKARCTTAEGVLLVKGTEESEEKCLPTLMERQQPEDLHHFVHVLRLQDGKEMNKGQTVWRKRA